jgi:NAD(P) transhydrogenase
VAYDYDLMVIGSGPAGQKAGIQAAKLGRRVALVDCGHVIGGVCINTGTIPSKTLREAVLYLTGMHQRGIYGESYRVKHEIAAGDLFWRMTHVVQREVDVVRNQLGRNGIRVIGGEARFIDPHTVGIRGEDGGDRSLSASRILIAVGTRPARPASVAFDGRTILDSDDIVSLDWIPSSLVVVGAGVIGIEYASMFAAVGTKVTVIEQRDRLLPFCDAQVIEALQYHLRDLGVIFRFGERVVGVEKHPTGAITHLASGKRVPGEAVLYSAGRQGAVDGLQLERAGLEADTRAGSPSTAAFAPPCATSTRPAM